MKKSPAGIVKLTRGYHSKFMDLKLNVYLWNTKEPCINQRDKINSRYGKQDFKEWKDYIKGLVEKLNAQIDPEWRLDGGVYVQGEERWQRNLNPIMREPLDALEYGKLVSDILFPNAKIYVVWFGNLTRDTKYFKKGQKVRYYLWGHNGIECRGGWLGYNKKTRKYEVHNIYHRYIKNIRFELVGHVDKYETFTYF